APDRPEPDDAERALRQFDSRKLLLAPFDLRVELGRVGLELRDVVERRNDIARGDEQRREHKLLHRVGIGTGGVEYRDATLRHLGDWNVVASRAGATDGLDARRNRHRVHVVRAHENRVGMVDRLADRVARARETMQPVARDLVQRTELEAGHWGTSPKLG